MIPEIIPLLAPVELSKNKANRILDRCAKLAASLSPVGETSSKSAHYYSSPGRTELGGNHTDHNNGCVLAASVDIDMIAAARPRNDSIVTLLSRGYAPLSLDILDTVPKVSERGSPASIIRGIAGWLSKRGKPPTTGFDIAVDSEISAGSGLSSSAAFELLLGAIFDDWGHYGLSPAEWASAGQFAENEYFGKPSGLMDQLACAVGGIVSIDFGAPAMPEIEAISYDFTAQGLVLAIVNTGSSHENLTDEYAAIPHEMRAVATLCGADAMNDVSREKLLSRTMEIREKLGDRAFLRAWHFVHETRRPGQMRDALSRHDVASYLSLVRDSGRSSWMYLQNIGAGDPRRQSLAIALALSEDLLGDRGAWRVHGGGFAGTIQAYVPQSKFDVFLAQMEAVFGQGCVRALSVRPYGVCRILTQVD